MSLTGNVTTVTSQPKNLRKAVLTGVEVSLTRRFNFLPGFLGGFGIEGNYTRIESEVEVPRPVGSDVVIDKTPLPNQSKNLFNAILFYERKGLTARLAGNYRGKSVETISQQLGPNFYTWSNTNFTVDFTASYTITPKIRAFLEVNNLTNEPLQTYLGDERRITNSEWYSQRGQVGIRWDIF